MITISDENTSVETMGIKSQGRSPGKKQMKKRRGKMNSLFFAPNGAASIRRQLKKQPMLWSNF
jgi:hypothetical protein